MSEAYPLRSLANGYHADPFEAPRPLASPWSACDWARIVGTVRWQRMTGMGD